MLSGRKENSVKRWERGDDVKNVLNYTPHEIIIVGQDGQEVARFPSAGLARCQVTRELCGSINGISLNETRFGKVEGLPEPAEDTVYIVSALVAQACKSKRDDVIVPDDTVRDDKGIIVGCRAFAVI